MTENLVQYRFSSYQFEFSLKIAVKYWSIQLMSMCFPTVIFTCLFHDLPTFLLTFFNQILKQAFFSSIKIHILA